MSALRNFAGQTAIYGLSSHCNRTHVRIFEGAWGNAPDEPRYQPVVSSR